MVSLIRLRTYSAADLNLQACDLNNAKRGFSLPIYCILCDGLSFEFFKFERTTPNPSFFRGCFPGDPEAPATWPASTRLYDNGNFSPIHPPTSLRMRDNL
jgi:hypothetical protein